jgi:tRNA(Ile)-lysidine synthase
MFRIQGKLPREVIVACSGGVDSMAIVDFLKRNHKVTLQFVHHGTDTSSEALDFLDHYTDNNDVGFSYGYINSEVPANVSQEEHWRNERYKIFQAYNMPVITCHHLDDCVETWIWSSMHGNGKIIPYRNQNVIRPFRLNRKQEFIDWCKSKNVDWVEDKSNSDNKYIRNYIRNQVVDQMLVINPGLHKVIMKKVEAEGE